MNSYSLTLFAVLQLGFMLAAFFIMLARHLPARLRLPVYIALGIQWLVMLAFAFFLLDWLLGVASLILSPLYALLARPAADRYAERFRR